MPILNPMVPGDVPFPQYSVTTTMPINDGLQIVKGVVYTVDLDGRLVAVIATLERGIFQARETPEGPAVEADGDEVQVLGPRTRMIFNDPFGSLVIGEDVEVIPDTINITNGAKSSSSYIGKIFEIYTRNPDSTKKIITEANDLVVVETVQP